MSGYQWLGVCMVVIPILSLLGAGLMTNAKLTLFVLGSLVAVLAVSVFLTTGIMLWIGQTP